MSLYKKLGFLCFFFSFLIVATKVKLVIVLILESFSAVSLLPPKIFSVFFFFASFLSSWCSGIHFKGSGFNKNNKEPETGKYTQVWQTHLHEQDRLFSSRHPK